MGDYGLHTPLVMDLLAWIDSGQLLHGRQPPTGPYEVIPDFKQAILLAQTPRRGSVDWTEVRDGADATLYPAGLLDTPQWRPHKQNIEDLLFVIGDKVHQNLPEEFRKISDDVVADLRACATCLAVHGKLDAFHALLWGAYECGGWPCGCIGPAPESPDDEVDLARCKIAVYWRPSR